jgi:ankyrin repeat protein
LKVLLDAGARVDGGALLTAVEEMDPSGLGQYGRRPGELVDPLDDRKSLSDIARVACMHLLLEHGADVNEKNEDGDTALHLAVTRCDVAAVKLLLASKADSGVRNTDDKTPLELAQLQDCPELVEVLTHRSRLQRLLSPPTTNSSRRMEAGKSGHAACGCRYVSVCHSRAHTCTGAAPLTCRAVLQRRRCPRPSSALSA